MSERAAPLLKDTYTARSEVLGQHHLHTLRTKFWLALVWEHLGLAQEAQHLLEETFSDTTRTLGESHADTLRVMHCLASLYARQGRLNEAAEMFKQGYILKRTIFGENHAHTIQARKVWHTFESAIAEKKEIARYAEDLKHWCSKESRSDESLIEVLKEEPEGSAKPDEDDEFSSLEPLL